MAVDSGDVYDSAFIQLTVKKRLIITNLFIKVAILPVVNNRFVDLYVVVKESFYVNLAGTGYDYCTYRFGQTGNWWVGRFGIDIKNFRGEMETIRLSFKASGLEYPATVEKVSDFHPTEYSLRLLEWRALGISWSKPLFPSKYSVGVGFSYDNRPDELSPFIHNEIATRLSVGRKFFEHSQVNVSIIPDFRKNTLLQPDGVDTTMFELFTAASWSIDRRQKPFDPSNGWSLWVEVRSNEIYHGEDSCFTQFSSDFSYYQPLVWDDQKLAFRMRAVVRTSNGGYLNRIMTGGESSVRGYFPNQIGLEEIGNDAFLLSGEYRFRLCYLPAIPLTHYLQSMASGITCGDRCMSFRLDGALFTDYGRVTANIPDYLSFNGPTCQSGLGIGCGLRFMETQKNIRLSFDLAWPENPYMKGIHFSCGIPGSYLYAMIYF